jgi:hypothetical protein
MMGVVVIVAVTVIMMFHLFSLSACFCRFFLGLFFGQKVKAINSSEIRGITTQKTVSLVNFGQEQIISIKSLEKFLTQETAAFTRGNTVITIFWGVAPCSLEDRY